MVVVTGAAGFIGSHVVEALLARGEDVVGLDGFNDAYSPTIKRANLAPLASQARFRLVEGDIRDPAALAEALPAGRVEAVVHLAALAGVRPSVVDPGPYVDVNVRGTALVIERAAAAGARRFVLASSSSVYGNSERVPFTEDDAAVRPVSPYGASKRSAELMAVAASTLHEMGVTILRLFTVYGPRQRPEMAIHAFTRLILAGRPVPVFGDGLAARDYTFVTDVVDGILAALELPGRFTILNLGGSRSVELSELVQAIGRACGRPVAIERRPDQAGDVRRTWADISRARSLLGWEPRIGLEDGIARFVAWFRALPAERREPGTAAGDARP
jgi:UDP-glucuronate 4-epimerase